jgi:hypothetical protein
MPESGACVGHLTSGGQTDLQDSKTGAGKEAQQQASKQAPTRRRTTYTAAA